VSESIRVVAWNVRAGGGRRVDEIAAQLRRWRADVVAISEFRDTPPSARLRDLIAEDGLAYHISTANGRAPAENRLLLASRWPLRRISLRRAPNEAGKWILAKVATSRPFTIGAMHIPNVVTGRKYVYHDAILDVVRRWRGGPAMLIGDTNSGRIDLDEETPVFSKHEDGWMRSLDRARWPDAFRHLYGENRSYTWYSPNGGNGFRLDEAFVNRRLLPRLIDTEYVWGSTPASDRRDALSDHAAQIVVLQA
jgi:exonuclease III